MKCFHGYEFFSIVSSLHDSTNYCSSPSSLSRLQLQSTTAFGFHSGEQSNLSLSLTHSHLYDGEECNRVFCRAYSLREKPGWGRPLPAVITSATSATLARRCKYPPFLVTVDSGKIYPPPFRWTISSHRLQPPVTGTPITSHWVGNAIVVITYSTLSTTSNEDSIPKRRWLEGPIYNDYDCKLYCVLILSPFSFSESFFLRSL